MNHLTPEELGARLDQALEGEALERVERHLAECADCRAALAGLAAQDTALRALLEHDPGEAYFETFAARVEDRIRAAGLKGAQARLGTDGWLGWLRSPRRLAWAGAVAAVVAGAGIVMLTTRPERPLIQSPEVGARLEQRVVSPKTQASAREAETRAAAPLVSQHAAEPAYRQPVLVPERGLTGGSGAPELNRVEGKLEDVARDESDSRSKEAASAPAEAPASPRAASPQRAQPVRRTAAGEDVPVRSDEFRFAEPPPTTGGGADLKKAKPQLAQPMEEERARSSVAPLGLAADKDAGTRFCGQVVDDRGRPVAGSTVVLADVGRTAIADRNGRFCLQAAAGLHELTAMAVGYAPARMQVRVEGEATEARVVLRAVPVLEGGLEASGGRGLSQATGSAADFFSAAPESVRALVREAERLADDAANRRSAAGFDDAAATWERVIAAAPPKRAALEGRYRLAEARFKAWEIGKNETRAAAARSAVGAYLAAAPLGPRRDQVLEWRDRLAP